MVFPKRLTRRRSRWTRGASGVILSAVGLLCLPVTADDEFEKFKRAAEAGVADIQQEFRSAVAEQDREFAEHLKTQWAEFQAFPGRVQEFGPKPRALPIAPVKGTPSGAAPRKAPRAATKPGLAVQPKADLAQKSVPMPAPQPRTMELPPPRGSELPPSRATVSPLPAQPSVPAKPTGIPRDEPGVPATSASIPPDGRAAPPLPIAPPPIPSVVARPTPAPTAPAALEVPTVQTIALDFYGSIVKVAIDPAWRTLPPVQTNPDGLSAFWDRMSGTQYQPALDAIGAARRTMVLDDWGHALLWQEVAKALQPTSQREQLLILWFFLVKSGFDTRPGYSDSRLLLLVNVRQSVYGASYIKLDNLPYYELFGAEDGKGGGRYAAYSGRYPSALRPLDIKVAATGFGSAVASRRAVEFESGGKRVRLDLAYERPLTRYLDRFPQLDFELYFTTPPSPVARRSLTEALAPHLRGLKQEEAVDLLLAFVQKAFEYKTDKDQFGREKYFFVEEVLHFPYSDCEDRSAIFSWLVRELLGIDTVGLHYPGHMTTAVALSPVRAGWQTVEWRGKRYVIADPTYINASVGMAMPSYRDQKPLRVVELR
jgi:hypothetical protein